MCGLISSGGDLSDAWGRLALEAAALCWSVMFLAFVEGWGAPAGCWCSPVVLAVFLPVLPRFFSRVWFCVVPGPPVLFFLITGRRQAGPTY